MFSSALGPASWEGERRGQERGAGLWSRAPLLLGGVPPGPGPTCELLLGRQCSLMAGGGGWVGSGCLQFITPSQVNKFKVAFLIAF